MGKQMTTTQQHLSLREKAAQLAVCEETVRRHAKELGGIKVGKLWRFPYDLPRLALPDSTRDQGHQQCRSLEQLQEQKDCPLGPKDSVARSMHSRRSTASFGVPERNSDGAVSRGYARALGLRI